MSGNVRACWGMAQRTAGLIRRVCCCARSGLGRWNCCQRTLGLCVFSVAMWLMGLERVEDMRGSLYYIVAG